VPSASESVMLNRLVGELMAFQAPVESETALKKVASSITGAS
jgi:hypothetical protein